LINNNCKANEEKERRNINEYHILFMHWQHYINTSTASGLLDYGLRIHVDKILIGKEEPRVAKMSERPRSSIIKFVQ